MPQLHSLQRGHHNNLLCNGSLIQWVTSFWRRIGDIFFTWHRQRPHQWDEIRESILLRQVIDTYWRAAESASIGLRLIVRTVGRFNRSLPPYKTHGSVILAKAARGEGAKMAAAYSSSPALAAWNNSSASPSVVAQHNRHSI